MGFIIDSGRISTEARRESFYINFHGEDTIAYGYHDGKAVSLHGCSVEVLYTELPHLVKALAELAQYLVLHGPVWPGDAIVAGQSRFEPEQNAHQFSMAGFVMEPDYEFVDGALA